MKITIKPLTAELTEDYLNFFDNMRFTENPDWSACYCFSFHFKGTNEQWNRDNNRASVVDYINENKMTGYLAYSGNKPVGWCNANNRLNYSALHKYYEIDDAGDKVCSIVCFVTSPEYRRMGIAQRLLEQVCIDYTARDYDFIEAYPGKGKLSCERHYKGPPELYKKFKFKMHKEFDDYFVVRRALK